MEDKFCKKCDANCTLNNYTLSISTAKFLRPKSFGESKLVGTFCRKCTDDSLNRSWWKKLLGIDELK